MKMANSRGSARVIQDDCLSALPGIPDASVQLVVTSPPYNIGKPYERRMHLEEYLAQQRRVITECVRVLKPGGSVCWQVGNWVNNGEIVPLDIALFPIFAQLGLKCRNRIVWHFEHGLHCSTRFSGRHETILWFTQPGPYLFKLDPVRVPQKYPAKRHFKGPRIGQLSGNPLGKNPGDVWVIPNVKHNHIEKTDHPCQFPVELVERLVLSMTNTGDTILDPFAGVGSAAVAAALHDRKSISIEIDPSYCEIARHRIDSALRGTIRVRPMDRPVYQPNGNGNNGHNEIAKPAMRRLLERKASYKA
jgi:adenine-specific DNA-methyltransferase